MSALRNRDVLGGPVVREAAGSTPARLIARALAILGGPEPHAQLYRAGLLRDARIAGARYRADEADIIAVVADLQASRAGLRRRRLPPDVPPGARSTGLDLRPDALLDDVLVAIVRGYEGRLEPEPPLMPPSPTAASLRGAPAHRPAPACSPVSSKRA